MTPEEKKKKLKKLIEFQVETISDLNDSELYNLVLEGFPAYGKMSDEEIEKEWNEMQEFFDEFID